MSCRLLKPGSLEQPPDRADRYVEAHRLIRGNRLELMLAVERGCRVVYRVVGADGVRPDRQGEGAVKARSPIHCCRSRSPQGVRTQCLASTIEKRNLSRRLLRRIFAGRRGRCSAAGRQRGTRIGVSIPWPVPVGLQAGDLRRPGLHPFHRTLSGRLGFEHLVAVGCRCTYDWAGATWGLAYIDTNAKDRCYTNYRGRNIGDARAVFTVTKTF